jgi:hypothetical protein
MNFVLAPLLGMSRHHLHEEKKNIIEIIQIFFIGGKSNKKNITGDNQNLFFCRKIKQNVDFIWSKGPFTHNILRQWCQKKIETCCLNTKFFLED